MLYTTRFGASILLDVAYGHKVTSDDDGLVKIASEGISELSQSAGRQVSYCG